MRTSACCFAEYLRRVLALRQVVFCWFLVLVIEFSVDIFLARREFGKLHFWLDSDCLLLEWITALHAITDGQIVPIDGKTVRGSYDKASSKSAIHMVSAWATENHITLGQVVTDAKSNEITAIPKLLKMLEISGALVTIDAMGCQTKIAVVP